jgi:hypothetical protein
VDSEEDEKDLLGTPVIFYDTAGCEYFERLDGDGDEGSRCNENEAVVVKGWVEQLVRPSSSPPPQVPPVSTDTSVFRQRLVSVPPKLPSSHRELCLITDPE